MILRRIGPLEANLLEADLLIILTDMPGLYTADPRSNPDAQLIPLVEQIDDATYALAGGAGTSVGTGGMVTKIQAAHLASRSGVITVIANGNTAFGCGFTITPLPVTKLANSPG